MSSELSRARLQRLHVTMTGYVERGEVPGLVTYVSRRGEEHVDAVGTTAMGGGAPVQRDTIFRISSMTKPITATAAMILVEECRLRLDEPVDRLLPELANARVLRSLDSAVDDTVPADRPISVRDLLTFRLGTGMIMAMPGTYPIQVAMDEARLAQGPPSPSIAPGPDEWIKRLGTLPLIYQPGERWMYNTGSDVLGVLIARAAGQPFDTFLRERIFEPLGMVDTGFSVPADKINRLVTSYSTDFATGTLAVYDEAATGQWSRPPSFPSGAGGLVSTVDDFAAFARMLLNKGRHGNDRILSRPSVETMTTDQLTPAQKAVSGLVAGFFDSHGWGFGVSVVTHRVNIWEPVGRFGWDGGLGTSGYSDPHEDMITILMTQRAWTSPAPPDVCVDFSTLAYQAIDD
jgi:CubicO group peptidase (beta-lactamase class C family)